MRLGGSTARRWRACAPRERTACFFRAISPQGEAVEAEDERAVVHSGALQLICIFLSPQYGKAHVPP
jgi:hypothetical protein